MLAILAKSGQQLLVGLLLEPEGGDEPEILDQPSVELLQAYVLAWGTGQPLPASPSGMAKLWRLLARDLRARQGPPLTEEADSLAMLVRETRFQTTYYRNIFNSDDAAEIVPALLSRADAISLKELGFRLSDIARALFGILNMIVERFQRHAEVLRALINGHFDDADVNALFAATPLAAKLWARCSKVASSPKERGWVAFQVAEMACAPLFYLERAELDDRFGPEITNALFTLSLAPGALVTDDLTGVHLDNPVWRRPFVKLGPDTLMLPLPGLIVSFPFAIAEQLIPGDGKLPAAYSSARASYLEDEVERLLREGLPSASVHRGVKWTDPATGKTWEHDVVAVLGNHVVVFEAKAGRLKDAARRGGTASLIKNFRELFVAPGIQARRLYDLLATGPTVAGMLRDRGGHVLPINYDTPTIVSMFGACIEHLAALSSSRHRYVELQLAESGTPWTPILSLGELRMLSTFLDTEVSFFHYLTRRASIDDVMTFSADEQDLLSMYLTNGLAVDGVGLAGAKVFMHRADAAVRGRPPVPGVRTRFESIGVFLAPWWRLVAKEIYEDASARHRFDMLEVLLNQRPDVLTGIERRIRRWRSGAGLGGGNTVSARAEIGDRVFMVAVHMAKALPQDDREWRDTARAIASDLNIKFNVTDCLILLRWRKSKEMSYDGISFFRFPRKEKYVH
ncbi:hypothetical protein SAMN02982994_6568 [Azospirillum lipoferum]|nr:hypothetical protein SAMN02982994_6568 [Azospirillum lipoferum]